MEDDEGLLVDVSEATDKSANDHERARQFVHLISKIDYDSILTGIKKNPNLTFGEFKLCDLMPENWCSTDSGIESGSVSTEDSLMKIELANNDVIGTSDDDSSNSITATPMSKVKRAPVEDIHTIGSSSESDVEILRPIISPPPFTIPNVASTSQIKLPRRRADIFSIHQQSSAIVVAKPIRDDETIPRRMADTTSAYRQHIQFLPAAPANPPKPEIVIKSQIPLENVPPLHMTADNRLGAIPKVRNNTPRQEGLSARFNNHKRAQNAQVVEAVSYELQNVATSIEQPAAAVAATIQAPIEPSTDQVQATNKNAPILNIRQVQQQRAQQRQEQQQRRQQQQQQQPQREHQQQRQQHQQEQQRQRQEQQRQRQEQQRQQKQQQRQQQQRQRQQQQQQQRQQEQQQRQQEQQQRQQEQQQQQQQRQQEQQQRQQQQTQNENQVICMEIYNKLRNVFPNVDPDYIKKLCPPEWGPGDRDTQLAPLIEHLLEGGDSLPIAPVIDASGRNYGTNNDARKANGTNDISGNVDDIYETLLEIFPDADPLYLREFAKKNVAKPNSVKEFVESKLENRDYPTREEYMARLKITQQQRQYTTGFDIKHFLTIIPDPFKHFMDPGRKCTYNEDAFQFLTNYFSNTALPLISSAYETARYNLSLAAADLERIGAIPIINRRGGLEITPKDVLSLQEIAFIKNKKEINTYLENAKRQEETDFKMLKEQNFLIECLCCYDTECVPTKCSSCDNGHAFCNNCVINGTSSKMSDGETRISCFINCGSEFSLSTLQEVLKPTTFSILLRKRQAAEVIEAGLEGLVACPFCHFASIPPENDKIFKCLNPECTKESCRLCNEPSHIPLKCDEVVTATDKARCYIEEKMTKVLARKCYKCQRAYLKETGCNKITCPCGAIMCYLCDQAITGYDHFSGQGRYADNKCPLHSDTNTLDAIAIRKVAEKAQLEVMNLNPNVKIDTAKLLVAVRPPNYLPLTDAQNAAALPLHAQRILDQEPEPL